MAPMFITSGFGPSQVDVCGAAGCGPLLVLAPGETLTESSLQAMLIGPDLNGDGEADAYVSLSTDGAVFIAAISLTSLAVVDRPLGLQELAGGGSTRGRLIRVVEDTDAALQMSAADVDGNGADDLVVGVPASATWPRGAVAVCLNGCREVSSLAAQELDGENGFIIISDTATITSAAGLGDINMDGYDDIAVGTGDGGLVVVYGQPPAVGFPPIFNLARLTPSFGFVVDTSTAVAALEGSGVGGSMTWLISARVDVSADGVADVLFGLKGSSRAFVLFGRQAPPPGPPAPPLTPPTLLPLPLPTIYSPDGADLEFVGPPTESGSGGALQAASTAVPYTAPRIAAWFDGTVSITALPREFGRPATITALLLQEEVVWLESTAVRLLLQLHDQQHLPAAAFAPVGARITHNEEVVATGCEPAPATGMCIAELVIPRAWFHESNDVIVSVTAMAGPLVSNQVRNCLGEGASRLCFGHQDCCSFWRQQPAKGGGLTELLVVIRPCLGAQFPKAVTIVNYPPSVILPHSP